MRLRAALPAIAMLLGACASPLVATSPPPAAWRVPGTRVSLAVPEGFEPSYQFAGLIDPRTLASVVVTEVPHAPSLVLEGMNSRSLAARGAELVRTESLRIDGRDAWLLHAVSGGTSGRGTYRWILVTGEREASAVVAAMAPLALAERLALPLREVLLSVVWDPDLVLGPYDGLGFEVSETERLKLSDRLPRMVSFTRDGYRGALAPEDPLFLAGASAGSTEIPDLAEFSHRELSGTAELAEIVVVSEGPLSLDGLSAYEILATAVDGRSGTPLQIYQVVAVDGREYFPLQGLVGAELAGDFVPQFRAIVRSFRRTREPAPP